MIFVFDLDDTICDTDGYSEAYIKNFISLHKLPYKQIAKIARFAELKFDWPHEEAMKWYKEFGSDKYMHIDFIDYNKNNHSDFVNGLIKALEDIGYKGYLTIERECGENPAADIETAANHLRRVMAENWIYRDWVEVIKWK